MISVAVTTRDSIKGDLRDNRLVGESRWERQCIESLLLCSEIDKVYTLDNVVSSKSPIFSKFGHKFQSGLPEREYKNTILVGMDFWRAHFEKKPAFKGMLFNIFHGLWEPDLPLAEKLKAEYGKKIVFTYQFLESNIGEYIEGLVGEDYVDLLPVPGIPKVVDCNNFNKDILFWDQKFIFQFMLDKRIEVLFEWLREKLDEDASKKFITTTGFRPVDLKWHDFKDTAEEQFWSYDSAKILEPVRNQVVVYGSIGWNEMLDLHSEAKLPVPFPCSYGGAPLECSMYGLPFVGKPDISPIVSCEEYISMPGDINDYIDILERLYTDEDYYIRVGSSYRDFVRDRYTYEAFAKNFLNIVRNRGMV
jgi:hypothetical protein